MEENIDYRILKLFGYQSLYYNKQRTVINIKYKMSFSDNALNQNKTKFKKVISVHFVDGWWQKKRYDLLYSRRAKSDSFKSVFYEQYITNDNSMIYFHLTLQFASGCYA